MTHCRPARNNYTSYANLYAVDDPAGEGGKRPYTVSCQLGWDRIVATSFDGGRIWEQAGRLLSDPSNDPGTWPYAQYAAREDRVDVVVTDGHPDSVGPSAYHGYLRGRARSTTRTGRVLGRLGDPWTSAVSRRCCDPAPPAGRAAPTTTCGWPTWPSTR